MSKRQRTQRLQVNQYARPTAADVTCVADPTIISGENAIVYVTDLYSGRTRRGRVSITKDRDTSAHPLGVLVKTPAHEGVVDGLKGRLRDRGQRQPDSIVAMTGLVTVTLKSESTTIQRADSELLADHAGFNPLVLDKPRRQSATLLMYDRDPAAVNVDLRKTIDSTFRPPAKGTKPLSYPHMHSANPFDVNMKVAMNQSVRLGDILVAEMLPPRAAAGGVPAAMSRLKSESPVLEVCSICDASDPLGSYVVVGVAMSESVMLPGAKPETSAQAGRRRYIPVRVGGTVSINDSWRCFFGTDQIRNIVTGSKYKQASPAVMDARETLLRGRLDCFIQPLQIHSVAGFHARIGRFASE